MLSKSRRLSLRNLLTALLVLQLVLLLWRVARAPVKLLMVVPNNEIAAWQSVVTPFEAEHLKIRIGLVDSEATGTNQSPTQLQTANLPFSTPDDRLAVYKADLGNETATYDLVLMDVTWTAPFADDLVDLGELVKRDNIALSDFLDSEVEVGTYKQKLYRMPMYADVGLLFYRKDLTDEAALPSTLDNLTRAIANIETNSSVDASYLWQGESYEGLVVNFLEVLSSFGGYWIKDESVGPSVGLSEPAAKQAASLMRELIRDSVSPPTVTSYTEQDSLQALEAGQGAFLRGWPGFLQSLEAQFQGDQIAIAPPFSFGSAPAMGCRGGWGFGIPKNSRYKAEAWEAIKYLTSEPAQKRFVLASNLLPTRRSLFEDPEIVEEFPLISELLGYLESSDTFRPTIPQYQAASEILQDALSRILVSDSISIEATMDAAQAETEALLRS
ncbi:MAG: extracellular solute-binding protein [Phormidesmis sp.]